MKIAFFSEDTPEGEVQEWPVVPRVGEAVSMTHPGGTSAMIVKAVTYYATTHANLRDVRVDLVYPDANTYMLHDLGQAS